MIGLNEKPTTAM